MYLDIAVISRKLLSNDDPAIRHSFGAKASMTTMPYRKIPPNFVCFLIVKMSDENVTTISTVYTTFQPM